MTTMTLLQCHPTPGKALNDWHVIAMAEGMRPMLEGEKAMITVHRQPLHKAVAQST